MESVYLTNEYHSNTEGVIKKVGEYLDFEYYDGQDEIESGENDDE